MNRCANIIVCSVLVLVFVTTTTADISIIQNLSEVHNDLERNSSDTTAVDEGRFRRRPHLFGGFGFHPLMWGWGGAHAIAIWLAIKAKIVIVAVFLIATWIYYSKYHLVGKHGGLFGLGNCIRNHHPHIIEGAVYPIGSGYLDHPPEGYSSHSDIISSYPGPEPYSSYSPDFSSTFDHSSSFDHSDHSDHSISIDHSAHSDHSLSFSDHDPHQYDGGSNSFDPGQYTQSGYLSAGPPSEAAPSPSAAPATYRGYSSTQDVMMNWGELAFQFLGVDTDGCRRRFVCELDFRARGNPMTRMFYGLINHSFFDRYRNLGPNDDRAKSFADCSRLFNDCDAAEKYNNPHGDEDVDDVSEAEEDPNDAENENQDDIDESADATETATDATTTTEKQNNDIALEAKLKHSKPLRRFILRSRI